MAVDGRATCVGQAERDDPVALVLTDVVVPDMDGKELFVKVSGLRPESKVLYMSGYTDDVVAQRGVMVAGQAFLHKPFTARVLSAKIREILDLPEHYHQGPTKRLP